MTIGTRAVGIIGAVALLAALVAGPARADDTVDQQSFVARINELRAAHGLAPLTVDERLEALARSWAVHLAAEGALSHNPNLSAQGPTGWTLLGENVGVGGDVQALHDAFVASPLHLANLLDARFTSIGIGVVMKGPVMWVAEELMASGPAPAAARAPTPPRAAVAKATPSKSIPAKPVPPKPVPVTVPAARPAPAPARSSAPVRVPVPVRRPAFGRFL